MSGERVYLDFNATTPLTDPCKYAMVESMNTIGNASSIHLEGRKVRALIEHARERVCTSLDTEPENIIFTSGASEGAAYILKEKNLVCAAIEHSCVSSWCQPSIKVSSDGIVELFDESQSSVQFANSETGILQKLPEGLYMSDVVQAIGKISFSFNQSKFKSVIVSAHKFGGPPGVGAVIAEPSIHVKPLIIGGGQERGRRSGTENLISVVGFGAAIEFAKTQLDDGVWEQVAELRDLLEDELANSSPNTIFVGKGGARLPNTSCFITPGWTGQMQVMQMDLAGFSISAGSACSSGKVSRSNVLIAMGFSSELAGCSVRVSIGSKTTKHEVYAFVQEWSRIQNKRQKRVA